MDEKKKTIIITIVLALVAVILIAVFAIVKLVDKGVIGSVGSSEIVKTFNNKYESKEKQVIYYASPSCGYCSLQTPILEVISEDYDMDYYYLDSSKLSTSERKDVLAKLEMEQHATPVTAIVQNGKLVDKVEGYTQASDYIEFFKDNGMIPEDAVYSEEKYITFIDYDKYEELIKEDETSIIVIGQTTCSHCIAIKPALNSVAGDYDLTIYYLNLTDMTEEESNSFFDSLTTIEYNDEDFLNDGSFGTPLTLVVKNGKVKNYISGEKTTSQLVKEFKKFGLIKE